MLRVLRIGLAPSADRGVRASRGTWLRISLARDGEQRIAELFNHARFLIAHARECV